MFTNFAETTVSIELGGKTYRLYFDCNSMAEYENATGKFFLDTVSQLYDAMRPALDANRAAEAGDAETPVPVPRLNAFEIIHKVPMRDLRALLWSALHEYDAKDNPVWPLTINQVGRLIQLQDVPRVFTAFLRGQVANSPTAAEMGESPAPSAPPQKAVNGSGTALKAAAAPGGEISTELPEDAFD